MRKNTLSEIVGINRIVVESRNEPLKTFNYTLNNYLSFEILNDTFVGKTPRVYLWVPKVKQQVNLFVDAKGVKQPAPRFIEDGDELEVRFYQNEKWWFSFYILPNGRWEKVSVENKETFAAKLRSGVYTNGWEDPSYEQG